MLKSSILLILLIIAGCHSKDKFILTDLKTTSQPRITPINTESPSSQTSGVCTQAERTYCDETTETEDILHKEIETQTNISEEMQETDVMASPSVRDAETQTENAEVERAKFSFDNIQETESVYVDSDSDCNPFGDADD